MSSQKKLMATISSLIPSPDKAQLILKIVKNNVHIVNGILVVVLHPVDLPLDSNAQVQESCLVFLEESTTASMPPTVYKIIPIYSDLKHEIVQSSILNENKKPDLLVVFSVNQDSASVVFPDRLVMSEILKEVKSQISAAESLNLSSQNNNSSHEWTEVYHRFCEPSKKKPTRSNSLPLSDSGVDSVSALRYVLPNQRAETLANINLKRTRTVAAPKERTISFESAKRHYIMDQLMKREDEFVSWDKTTVFVGTWNVHGSLPDDSLKDWLQGALVADDGKMTDPDFYVIGLQEMDGSASAYITYDLAVENAWVNGILDALKDEGKDYYKVESRRSVTILLVVIAKKKHKPFISELSSIHANVGVLNMLGNKGGIAVRFRFYDSYLCFLTCHLAAFTEQIDRRNQDFKELTKRLIFPNEIDPITSYVSYHWNDGGDEGVSFVENQNVPRDWSVEASIFHSDILIWSGDMNYRVNLHESVIKNLIRQNKIKELIDYDQLTIERNAGRTFQMFNEGEIKFNPTYKYDAGTNNYDTSEKRRAPSWTDRILWKKNRNESAKQSVELLSYNDCMKMMTSDHKPVRALMNLNIRKISSEILKKTQAELEKGLLENQDHQPRGEITEHDIIFKEINFMEYLEKHTILKNVGQVVTSFKFISYDESEPAIPPWLQVTPTSGVVAPGDKVFIRFSILIDPTLSATFNRGNTKLEKTLILRLENSKDFFITVFGNYQRTCFGIPLDELDEMFVDISEEAALVYYKADIENQNNNPTVPLSRLNQITVPKQLWKILNFLWNKNMFCIDKLFLEHGELVYSTHIRKCLDNDEPFDTSFLLGDQSEPKDRSEVVNAISELSIDNEKSKEAVGANSMVDVLVAFLECLPEPVIPSYLYERALEASESLNAMNYFKDTLVPFRRAVLLYIGTFLRQAIDKAPLSVKRQREDAIVELFSVLLRPPIDFKERNPLVAKEKREMFVYQLLRSLK